MPGEDPEILLEIETAVAEAVGRFGVAGDVRISGARIVLQGAGPSATAELGQLVEQWSSLPAEMRQRRATALARQLVERRRASQPPPPRRSFSVPGFIAPVAILAIAGVAIWMLRGVLLPSEGAPPSATTGTAAAEPTPGSVDAYEAERAARAERVCQATRSRIMRGATIGPTDVEGWVVELTLLRDGSTPELTFDPGLSSFVERRPGSLTGRFAWAGANELVAVDGPDTRVQIADASIPEETRPVLRGVRLVFTGRYVPPYFREEERAAFVRTAAALAERLGATWGALFARCAQGSTHHIGSWFRGPGPGGAAASLAYFMGAHAEPSQIRASIVDPDGGALSPRSAGALLRIGAAAESLDRAKVAKLLGANGGMIAGRTDGPGTITFPFKDGNRAARASRDVARAIGVSVER